jgi:long-chain acyl-CoA synthetase
MKTIFDALQQAVSRYPERIALHYQQQHISYIELLVQAEQLAKHISGWRLSSPLIGIVQKNSIEYVVTYFALLLADCIPVLIDSQFNQRELDYLTECGIYQFVIGEHDALAIQPMNTKIFSPFAIKGCAVLVSTTSFETQVSTAICRLTSGSTGKPKILEFSHLAVINAATHWIQGTRITKNDKILCLAALSNGLAFNTSLLPVLLSGACLFLFKGFLIPSSIVRLIREHSITRLVAFPAFYELLCQQQSIDLTPLKSLTFLISSGSRLSDELRQIFVEHHQLNIADYYGVAEVGPVTFQQTQKGYGVGQILPGNAIKIDQSNTQDIGEIFVKTTSMATCYLNFPNRLEQHMTNDGFYRTGDLGYLDEQKNLFITGRINDTINVAGRNIDTYEIQDCLQSLGGIKESVIFADKDQSDHTIVHLVVVASTLTKLQIITHLKSQLSAFKVPGKISFVSHIPRNGVGKPVISTLKQEVE